LKPFFEHCILKLKLFLFEKFLGPLYVSPNFYLFEWIASSHLVKGSFSRIEHLDQNMLLAAGKDVADISMPLNHFTKALFKTLL